MTHRLRKCVAAFALAAAGIAGTAALLAVAEDLLPSYKAAPEVYTLAADKDGIQIVVATVPPGHRTAMHSHRAMASYWLTPCLARFHLPYGSSRDVDLKAGAAAVTPTVSIHETENRGTTECKVVLVEYGK
jgi:mannose-6-phosphate isomerase-like protein (cupin superfamily)